MKTFTQPFKQNFLKISFLLLILFSTACKKDLDPLMPASKKAIVFFGGQDGNFYALNAQTGDLVWKYHSDGNFSYSAPALEDSTLYSTNTDHNLYALSAITGALKWKFTTASSVISSPAVVNNIVYFGSDDHYIYAVDAVSGNLKWKYLTFQNVDSSPVVANGVVYIGSADGNLYALDALTGNLKWKYDTGSIIVEAIPVISNDVVFIGNRNGYLNAINATNGQLKWTFSADGISLEQAKPSVNNGVIYLASWYNVNGPNQPGSLFAIKESDGSQIWKALNGQGFTSSPVYADGKVFINSDDLNIYAVDAATGNEAWKKSIVANGAVPTVANGKVYAGGGGSNAFYVLDSATGNESWKLALTNCIDTSKPLIVSEK
ncbi:PQQ-binding-like beta-propeller repeat protein [Mucilaginibacter sp. BJC16-A38]|uniref:outer membrane protein assembly factor BamB family protein n=1 Tax=Mucilaginibacter phenanthrenivorans TaxID=1234842 RepID=UPI002157BBCB|nr:PQQ-binding-like beta-propeller repeat protein [Mucilaginibacter phenanthrenivorans]MCR8557675.1 PQQ-binding-like beta-propeller repeat protein [Mucilaginibacter phenanthrenivorans]